jgi:hypothetical protein
MPNYNHQIVWGTLPTGYSYKIHLQEYTIWLHDFAAQKICGSDTINVQNQTKLEVLS